MTQDFPPAPLNRFAWLALAGPAVAIALGVLLLPRDQTTPWPLLAGALVVALALVGPLLALRRRRIRIEGHTLVVAATLYTQRIDVDAFDLDHARIIDLAEHTDFAPVLGLNRFGLPGLRAGHYLLRNRARAFCLLTRRDRVLLLPRRDGRFVLLSPDKPQPLLSRLRELAAVPARG